MSTIRVAPTSSAMAPEAGEVHGTGVGGVAGHYDLGTVLLCEGLDLGEVNELGLALDAIGHDVVLLAGRS